MNVIEVDGLVKSYDDRVVVDGVSFSVEEGEIFAILGPNGAGKTTTVESIAGLRTPDSGRIQVFGFDPLEDRAQVRSHLGVQLQESRFQDRLKVSEVVETFAALYPDPLDVSSLLERLGLSDKADTRYARLSGGQQQRLSIAVALIGRPRAVILDIGGGWGALAMHAAQHHGGDVTAYESERTTGRLDDRRRRDAGEGQLAKYFTSVQKCSNRAASS